MQLVNPKHAHKYWPHICETTRSQTFCCQSTWQEPPTIRETACRDSKFHGVSRFLTCIECESDKKQNKRENKNLLFFKVLLRSLPALITINNDVVFAAD